MKIRLDDVMQSLSYPFNAEYYYYIPLETVLIFIDGNIYGKAVDKIATLQDVKRHSADFIKLPDIGEEGRRKMVRGFVKSLPRGEARSNLKAVLQEKDLDRCFEDAVREEGLLLEWFNYREEVCTEFSRRWCEQANLEYIE